MKVSNIVSCIFLGIMAIALLGMAIALHGRTVLDWWIPSASCLLLSIPAAYYLIPLMRTLVRFEEAYLNYLAGFILSFALLVGGFYSLNYYMSAPSSHHEVSACILNKYTEERHEVKRVSRNRTVRGKPYKIYFIEVGLPEQKVKKIEVSAAAYKRYRKGQSMEFEMETGLFGVPVIKNLPFAVRKAKR